MINVEKLSLFNIDKFRTLYESVEDSYLCSKGFFDIYDRESFLIKYIIRKQVKLFKNNDEYVGYLWHEYPYTNKCCSIYGISFKNDFLERISSNIFDELKFDSLKLDIIQNNKNKFIMNRLGFNIQLKSIVMNLKLNNILLDAFNHLENIEFQHFRINKDETLRCDIQNKIFWKKNRIPLTVDDIYEEENEDYFLENFSVFLKNSNNVTLGYGQIILSKNQYTIVNFGILEEYRMKGYGEVLLKYLIYLCKINSIPEIFIRVEESNTKAINLYKKVGFKKYCSCITWTKFFK